MLSLLQTVLLCAGSLISRSVVCPAGSLTGTYLAEQPGVPISIPVTSNYTGIKKIPDDDHPFIAPGPDDQRGPCPGLNTLANHGYLPRNGIVTFAQIVEAVGEGFNMEYDLAAALAAFAMLGRGNAYLDLVSIGGESPLIPPLPGFIDGHHAPYGISKHGRFEGDMSITRQDAAIGDNVNFQEDLYDELLLYTGKYGDDSPVTGNSSVVTLKVMQEFKYSRFLEDQVKNPVLEYHPGRFATSYGEAAFVLEFFSNGTDGKLSVPAMGSFFRNQTFPQNFYRRSSPADIGVIGWTSHRIMIAHPLRPGANAPDGTYVPDIVPRSCDHVYYDLAVKNLPATLMTTTGLFRKNIDFLLNKTATPFDCPVMPPIGAPDI